MTVADTLIDTLFDGRYRIIRRSSARAGWRTSTSPRTRSSAGNVAIKILDERHAEDEQFVERFRREAKNAAGLLHPNIVSIYDRGEAEGTYYIAMEYLDGRTLKELIVAPRAGAGRGSRSTYARQILAALALRAPARDRAPRHQAAQRARRRATAALKVTDFGIARAGASADDRGRLDRRHGAVPLARAGARRAGRPALRPLLARGRALRDADRDGAVHGRLARSRSR